MMEDGRDYIPARIAKSAHRVRRSGRSFGSLDWAVSCLYATCLRGVSRLLGKIGSGAGDWRRL
jgi:hypothetical protein